MSIVLVSEYLDTYQGRDKLLRTLSYAAKLASGIPSSELMAAKFRKLGSKLSSCRVILRLLDDIPTVHYAMSYGWGKQESDWVIRCTELFQIVIDLIYCPVEHISWAGEHGFIKINTQTWDTVTTWFWLISLYLSLIKSIRKFRQFRNFKNTENLNEFDIRTKQKKINSQRRNELLTSLRLLLDMSYAVSYLPPGTLWGGRLKTWQIGALGTASSLIGLYQALSKRVAHAKTS